MKVTGEAVLHAPAERVWAALNDPEVLVRTIPGCEQLEVSGPDSYRLTATAGVASVRGTYAGQIRLLDRQEPTSFLMKADGAGSPGTVSTSVRVRLADSGNGSTRLTYDADAVIGGMIAGVGQRMLGGVAKRMASEFFEAVNGVLTGAELPGTATQERRGPAGAAGVAFPAPATPQGASGMTAEPPMAPGQPAGRPAPAAPEHGGPTQAERGVYVAPPRAKALGPSPGFVRGVLVGAAVALAGVVVGGLIGRRSR